MPKGPRKRKTTAEKIAVLQSKKASAQEQIANLKKKISEIDKELDELEKQKREEELGELYNFLQEKKLTVADVKKKFS